MISVGEASNRVFKQTKSFGLEEVALQDAYHRVLAEAVQTDRDIPACNRSTMDGIAMRAADVASGQREFDVVAVQAAGDKPISTIPVGSCIQIMTGAVIPDSLDTVVPIEDVTLSETAAKLTLDSLEKGAFVHRKGSDKSKGAVMIPAGKLLTPADIPIAAATGKAKLSVRRLPRALVVTTGDELVDITAEPAFYQLRRSNNYAVQAVLSQYGVVTDMIHLPDDPVIIHDKLKECLKNYDVIIISGGVSKGVFDYIPQVLTDLSVKMHFHGVKQKPGKPLWFGAKTDGTVVFALPGNPVSTFLCLHKYVVPWLQRCLGIKGRPDTYAVLGETVSFSQKQHYFLQVSLVTNTAGQLIATQLAHNGSGDYSSLSQADAFIELPAGKNVFKKGEVYKIVPLASIL